MGQTGYAPVPVAFQATASTKLAFPPIYFVGREGFEPPNNEDLIYSQAQLTTLPPTQNKKPLTISSRGS